VARPLGVELGHDEKGPFFLWQGLEIRFPHMQRKNVGLKEDPLKKAVGFKKGQRLRVLDLTAGLLRDSCHLAQMGCQVVALEENPLLAKGIEAFLQHEPSWSIDFVGREASDYLQGLSGADSPDCIYYDPMFESEGRKSLPGKESQFLAELVAPSSPEREADILQLALGRCRNRVVVKRSLQAPFIGDFKPHHSIKGKSVRYDVYLVSPNS
jgi:16S rRNA (guanine1516-N2)-methyltransferase